MFCFFKQINEIVSRRMVVKAQERDSCNGRLVLSVKLHVQFLTKSGILVPFFGNVVVVWPGGNYAML